MATTCAPTADVGGQHRAGEQDAAAADAAAGGHVDTAGATTWRSGRRRPRSRRSRATMRPAGRAPAGAHEQVVRPAYSPTRSMPPEHRDAVRRRCPGSAGSSSRTPERGRGGRACARRPAPRGPGRWPRPGSGGRSSRRAPRCGSTSITRACSDSDIWWNSGRISVLSVSCSVTGSGSAAGVAPRRPAAGAAAMMPRRAEMPASARRASSSLAVQREAGPTSTQNDWKLVVPHAGSATSRSPAISASAFA